MSHLRDYLNVTYCNLGFHGRTSAQSAFEDLAAYHYQIILHSNANNSTCANTFLQQYGRRVFPYRRNDIDRWETYFAGLKNIYCALLQVMRSERWDMRHEDVEELIDEIQGRDQHEDDDDDDEGGYYSDNDDGEGWGCFSDDEQD